MQTDYPKAEGTILVYEGGYSNNPKDPGGATMKGITQATYNSWQARHGLPPGPVKDIPDATVAAIYKHDYWDRMNCDEMPAGVDLCLFDAAVNSGVGGATSWAQGVLGLPTDGDFGPKTKAAILSDDPENFIRGFNSRRLATLKRLPTWGEFGKGWSARIANGQKIELAWAQAGEGPDPAQVHTIGGHAKAKPTDIPVNKGRVIATNITTAGGAAITGGATVAQQITPLGETFAWIKYILAGITGVSAIVGLIVYVTKTWDDQAANAQATAKVDPDADANVPSIKPQPITGVSVATATGAANG